VGAGPEFERLRNGMKISHFPALAGVFLVVGACNGMSSVGGDEGDAGDDMGGGAGGSMSGHGGTAGTSMRGGTGGTSGTGGTTPSPCAGKPCGAECSVCGLDSGNMGADPATGMGIPCDAQLRYCSADGECGLAFPVCETECNSPMDCVVIDLPCQICADGSTQCPTPDCQMGRCVTSYPSCGTQCMTDAECPTIAAPCQMCADGTTSCPKAECQMGRCTTSWPGCGGNDPCEGRECGEPCNPTCTAMGCGMISDVAFTCTADGRCAAEPPRCGAECSTVMDCPLVDSCFMCAGGTCGVQDCVSGHCQFVCPPVDPPEPQCMSAMDCVADTICRYCPDMSCAEIACINNECKSVCPL